MPEIDMRTFARNAGANVSFPVGSIVFSKGDPGTCMYVLQSGVVEMVIGDTVVDGAVRSSTARVREPVELSIIDQRRFRFMVDEVPNFANYIMGAMARRIRGMGQAIK